MMKILAACLVLAGTVVLSACDDDTDPTPETFSASMTGAKERPTPVVTGATGTASITVSANGDTVHYTVTATGLSGAVTAAHIHAPADTGGTAPPARTLTLGGGAGATVALGTFTALDAGLTFSFDSLLALMRNGRAYINVHTAANVSGEIRGQIVRP
jgi:Cu/Zn superoxide dismutase